ncbi:hypothetical protein [Anoxynatronum buryatiense]|nr:hypothetical protein [Anoxynatronum buryatiense]
MENQKKQKCKKARMQKNNRTVEKRREKDKKKWERTEAEMSNEGGETT